MCDLLLVVNAGQRYPGCRREQQAKNKRDKKACFFRLVVARTRLVTSHGGLLLETAWHAWAYLSIKQRVQVQFDFIANPGHRTRRDFYLWDLCCIPTMVAADAMTPTNQFVRAFNCSFCRHNMHAERSALRAFHHVKTVVVIVGTCPRLLTTPQDSYPRFARSP